MYWEKGSFYFLYEVFFETGTKKYFVGTADINLVEHDIFFSVVSSISSIATPGAGTRASRTCTMLQSSKVFPVAVPFSPHKSVLCLYKKQKCEKKCEDRCEHVADL